MVEINKDFHNVSGRLTEIPLAGTPDVYDNEFMLVYRECDATWYYGQAKYIKDEKHPNYNEKMFETKDSDRLLEHLRKRNTSYTLNIPSLIIYREEDDPDSDLLGWADPEA